MLSIENCAIFTLPGRRWFLLRRVRPYLASAMSVLPHRRLAPPEAARVCNSKAFFFAGSLKSTRAILEIRVGVDNVVPVHWHKSERNKPIIRWMLARDG